MKPVDDDAEAWRLKGQKAAKRIGYELPDGISMSRGPASDGVAFYFRHRDLGELGRVRLLDDGRGHGRLLGEVAGTPGDPMTAKRAELLAPLVQQVHHLLDEVAGVAHRPGGMLAQPGPVVDEPRGGFQVKLLGCDRCERPVARLIFAPPGTSSPGDFEDVARLTFSLCAEEPVPTWIVGPGNPLDILTQDDPMKVRSLVMAVWPERGALFESTPGQFNETTSALQASHCGAQLGARGKGKRRR